MKQRDHSTVSSPVASGTPKAERGPEVFQRAVQLIKTKHHVDDSSAYAMLVQRAVTSGTTVREAAITLIRASLVSH